MRYNDSINVVQSMFKCIPSNAEGDVHKNLEIARNKIDNAKNKRYEYLTKVKSLGNNVLDAMSDDERNDVINIGEKLDGEVSNAISLYNQMMEPLRSEYKSIKNEILTDYAIRIGKKPEDIIFGSTIGIVPDELISELDNIYNRIFNSKDGDHGILRKNRCKYDSN